MAKGKQAGLNIRTLKTLYLYGDGHAVAIREKHIEPVGKVQWAEIHEQLGPKCRFKGRVIFSSFYANLEDSQGLPNLLLLANEVSALESTGSEKTKELGLTVQRLNIVSKHWNIDLMNIPTLISGPFTYQPQYEETYAQAKDLYDWGGIKVTKLIPKEE